MGKAVIEVEEAIEIYIDRHRGHLRYFGPPADAAADLNSTTVGLTMLSMKVWKVGTGLNERDLFQ